MSRHMFYSANTPNGFHHFFSNILFIDEAQRVIYLKGSSGSGKSTFMKKAGSTFEEKGFEVDYIHCSNNPDDLDGIRVYELGLSIVDATYPHVCDPVLPKAVDEIFDSSCYINEFEVRKQRDKLISLQSQKKQYYDKAYRYLNAAYQVHLNNSYIYNQALYNEKLQIAINEEVSKLTSIRPGNKFGRNRKTFADAITPKGVISHVNSLTSNKEVVALYGKYGVGTYEMLKSIRQAANYAGLDTEGFYSVLDVEKLEHLIIPELNLLYTTINNNKKFKSNRLIYFDDFLNINHIKTYESEIEYNNKMFDELQQQSINMMAAQKEIHDQIENIYVSSMDFEKLSIAYDGLLDKI